VGPIPAGAGINDRGAAGVTAVQVDRATRGFVMSANELLRRLPQRHNVMKRARTDTTLEAIDRHDG